MTAEWPKDITKVELPEYVVVFAQGQPPPGEYQFNAISDEHAIGHAQELYATSRWVMYRLEGDHRERVYAYPEQHPGEGARLPERLQERHGRIASR